MGGLPDISRRNRILSETLNPQGPGQTLAHLTPQPEEINQVFHAQLGDLSKGYFEQKKVAMANGVPAEEAELLGVLWVLNVGLGIYSAMLEPKLAEALKRVER
jgi:hypothetical protein